MGIFEIYLGKESLQSFSSIKQTFFLNDPKSDENYHVGTFRFR